MAAQPLFCLMMHFTPTGPPTISYCGPIRVICICTYPCDHNKHMTSQPADTNVASDLRSALCNNDNELERLTCELDKLSQEFVNVMEQLHMVQLMVEDEQ